MSHVIFLTRGHYDHIHRFIDDLRTRTFEYPVFDKQDGEMKRILLKSRLSPIQLWDYVFPHEYKDPVLNTIFLGSDAKGVVANAHLQKYLWPMRKALKLDKIPDYKKDLRLPIENPQHSEMIGIGYKEDRWMTEKGESVLFEDRTPLSTEEF